DAALDERRSIIDIAYDPTGNDREPRYFLNRNRWRDALFCGHRAEFGQVAGATVDPFERLGDLRDLGRWLSLRALGTIDTIGEPRKLGADCPVGGLNGRPQRDQIEIEPFDYGLQLSILV